MILLGDINHCLKPSARNDEVKFLLRLALELDSIRSNSLNLIRLEVNVVPAQSRIVVVRDDTSLASRRVFRSELLPHTWLIWQLFPHQLVVHIPHMLSIGRLRLCHCEEERFPQIHCLSPVSPANWRDPLQHCSLPCRDRVIVSWNNPSGTPLHNGKLLRDLCHLRNNLSSCGTYLQVSICDVRLYADGEVSSRNDEPVPTTAILFPSI